MPKVGKLGLDMMLRTCTIQANLDYQMKRHGTKFQISLALQFQQPFLLISFYRGKAEWLFIPRAMVWTDTDPHRTGVPQIVFDDDFA